MNSRASFLPSSASPPPRKVTSKQHCPLSCHIPHFPPQHSQSKESKYSFVKPFNRQGLTSLTTPHSRVKRQHFSSNTKYHNKLPRPELWSPAKPQIFHFCRQDSFHSSTPPLYCTHPLLCCTPLFSISSLTNNPSPCV